MAAILFEELKAGLSPNAAILLYRIHYWMPKATIVRDGHSWIAKTRVKWADDIGRSLDQYKRALAELKREGKVIAEQHKFGKQQRPITFLRLRNECSIHEVQKCTTHKVVQNNATQEVQICTTPSIHRVTQQRDTTESLSLALARSSQLSPTRDSTKEGRVTSPADPMVQLAPEEVVSLVPVAEVAELESATKQPKQPQLRQLKASPPVKDSPLAMHAIWVHAMNELGQYVGPMCGADGGMFKSLIARCPPDSAGAVLAYAVTEWSGFKAILESEYGQWKISETPSLHVMVKHLDKLVTWWRRRKQEEAQFEARAALAEKTTTVPGPSSEGAAQPQRFRKPVSNRGSSEERFELLIEDLGFMEAKRRWLDKHAELPGKYAEKA